MKFKENDNANVKKMTEIEPQVMELAQCNATSLGSCKEADDLQIAIDLQKKKLEEMKK